MKKLVSILLVLALCLSMCAYAEDAWVCPNCGAKNTTPFCGQCGTEQPGKCPYCGKSSETPFCPYCGAKKSAESDVTAGDTVTFGTYGGETINWIVLETNTDGTCLLLSEKGLDAKPYNTTDTDITWEKCTLRKLLNGEFLNSAFTAEERSKIVLSKVTNPDNKAHGTEGGKDTEDYVYLLSLDEVGQYFNVDPYNMKGGKSEALICMPTDTAVKNGAWLFSQEDANSWQKNCSYPLKAGACLWWLRSPGYYCSSAAYVFNAGSVFYSGNLVYDTHVCVRPVVRARL